MANSRLSSEYQHIFLLNQSLLEMAREGSWDAFILMAEDYVVQLNQLVQAQQELNEGEREEFKQILKSLLLNEDEMVNALTLRMGDLKQEMASLGRGKQCTQAYASMLKLTVH